MVSETLFPTLGEFTKALFDLSGVLPTKGDADALFSETEKKSLQTLLARLSREQGELIGNYDKALASLYKVMEDISPSREVFLCIREIIHELEVSYKANVASEASHLSRNETIQWLLESGFVHRLVLSIYKNIYKYNVHLLMLKYPQDEYWFLPDFDQGRITTPLAKYLSWLYQEFDTTQTHFHYPGKISHHSECHIKKLNLDNASKWSNGKRLPTWAGLQHNLRHSLKALNECAIQEYRRDVHSNRVADLLFVAFVVRLSTKVCQLISGAYGEEFLQQLIDKFKRYRQSMQPHICDMQEITSIASNEFIHDLPLFNRECVEQIDFYWKNVADSSMSMAAELKWLQDQSISAGVKFEPDNYLNELQAQYSSFIVLPLIDCLKIEVKFTDSDKELITKILELESSNTFNQDDIADFQRLLDLKDREGRFYWFLCWLKAKEAHRRDDLEAAFKYYEDAFKTGKYSCGADHYKLINEYLLLAAKNNQWTSFKKGVDWACFFGIQVRLLRNQSPSERDVPATFKLFKKLSFAV